MGIVHCYTLLCVGVFMTNYNPSFDPSSNESMKKYELFINYHSTDSIQNTLRLLALLREIYADKVKSSTEQQILSDFSKKCDFSQEELMYHENKIKEEMGIITHHIPIALFWDIERICSIKNSSLFRVWVKNTEKSIFRKVSVRFIIDSDDIQIAPVLTERKLDAEQTLCFTAPYTVSENYLGGEVAFRIHVIFFDYHGQQWVYQSQDKLILNLLSNLSKEESLDTDTYLNQNSSTIETVPEQLHQGINNALKIPLVLANTVSDIHLNTLSAFNNPKAMFNLGVNIHSTHLFQKVEIVSYPFFTMGRAQNGSPLLSDLGIEVNTGISRLHLSFCYTHNGLKFYTLNADDTSINGFQIAEHQWQTLINNDKIGLSDDIELAINISENNDKPNSITEEMIQNELVKKLTCIIGLLADLKKHIKKREKNRLLKLLNKEYSSFLYMQKSVNNDNSHVNYIEFFHTENSTLSDIKYFYLVNNISIGSNLMEDNIYVSELAPNQATLSFSKGQYYLTQLDAMSQTNIVRNSEVIPLNRYVPEVLEINDVIQMNSEVHFSLYKI